MGVYIPTLSSEEGGSKFICMKNLFCELFGKFSLPAAGLFSRSRLRGTQGGRVYTTHGASLGPGRAPWRAFWAFEVAPAGSFTGLLSAMLNPKTIETP